jgi:ABC-type sulfate transport system substrate-binding protein
MKQRLTYLACGLMACWTLASCGTNTTTNDEVGQIETNLELADTGGYAMSDEVARFGIAELDDVAVDPNSSCRRFPPKWLTSIQKPTRSRPMAPRPTTKIGWHQ